jgi:uncharacterized membrane protein YbaN (DUF454 family)
MHRRFPILQDKDLFLFTQLKKSTYFTLGFLFLILAFIGAFLPLLPTTPFALLSAYFFSHSSERLHRWLLSLPILGPLIKNWEQHRIISLKAKINATFVMVCFSAWTCYRFWTQPIIWISFLAIMSLVLCFIWTRKSKV